MVRPVKRDEKLNPAGDCSGFDDIESYGLLIHDSQTLHLLHLCLASANKGVQACFLYNIGYRLLISGNRTSSLRVLKILENLDKNLSALLSSRIIKYLPNFVIEDNSKIS
jgi:hypothetical protein